MKGLKWRRLTPKMAGSVMPMKQEKAEGRATDLVLPAVWVMCFIEKRLHKIVPAMFDLFVTPLVSVFVTGYLTYSIIGLWRHR